MDWVYALSGIATAAGVASPDNYTMNQDPYTMAALFALASRGEFSTAPADVLALAKPPAVSAWRVIQASWQKGPGRPNVTDGMYTTPPSLGFTICFIYYDS